MPILLYIVNQLAVGAGLLRAFSFAEHPVLALVILKGA